MKRQRNRGQEIQKAESCGPVGCGGVTPIKGQRFPTILYEMQATHQKLSAMGF